MIAWHTVCDTPSSPHIEVVREGRVSRRCAKLVAEEDLKQWRDAGHVARRALEGIKNEITVGKSWDEVIDSAERFIRRHGGKAAFPVTISVNEMAAHYTTNSELTKPEGMDEEMVFEKGDLVKLDIGAHIKGALADNALSFEVGNGGNHTEQIKAAKKLEMLP